MAVREGETAPAFTLPTAPGETVDVGRHLGREPVVLLFFPLAFSPVCSSELGTLRDRWETLSASGARFFAVSVDSPFVTDRFRRELDLPFPVLSDFNREVVHRYGVVDPEMEGLERVAKRSVFAVDREGEVVYAWISEDPGREPDYSELRSVLGEI